MTNTLIPIDDARNGRLGGIGRTTVYRLINAGQLTRVNIGRRAFITAESIDAYIATLTEEAKTA